MNKKAVRASDLVNLLWPEVFQTEESARSHPAREAKRLGGSPPAAAMRAVSEHAASSLVRLQGLASERGHAPSILGRALGQAFSVARTFGSDLLMSSEKRTRRARRSSTPKVHSARGRELAPPDCGERAREASSRAQRHHGEKDAAQGEKERRGLRACRWSACAPRAARYAGAAP